MSDSPNTSRRIRVTFMVIVLVALVAAEATRRVGAADAAGIAPDLVGLWTTTDQRYGDRAFRITPDSLTLNLGDGGLVTYPIERVIRRRLEDATSYVVEYADPDAATVYKLPFLHKDGGIIQIANQDGVEWSRGGTAVIRSRTPSGGERQATTLSPLSDLLVICIKDATSRGQASSAVRCIPSDST